MTNSFFREAGFQWNGEDYVFVPSMKLLMRIENAGQSIEAISIAAQQGKIMKASMAMTMGIVMRYAGADVSDEEILQDIEHNPDEAFKRFVAMRDALYTEPPESLKTNKGGEADGKKPKGRKAKTG